MADETPPAPQPEPQPTPEPEPQPQFDTEAVARRVVEMLSQGVQPQQPQGGSFQAIAAIEQEAQTNPAAKFIMDLAGSVAQLNQTVANLDQRVRSGPKIAPERLADAEKEYATGRYASLEDADAAAFGRKILTGEQTPPRPKPRQVQTSVVTPPQPQTLENLTEVTASEYNALLQGPKRQEVWERRKSGKLTVVRD